MPRHWGLVLQWMLGINNGKNKRVPELIRKMIMIDPTKVKLESIPDKIKKIIH